MGLCVEDTAPKFLSCASSNKPATNTTSLFGSWHIMPDEWSDLLFWKLMPNVDVHANVHANADVNVHVHGNAVSWQGMYSAATIVLLDP